MSDGTATFPPLPNNGRLSHAAHSQNIRRVAFTLAEVLITLGIIGVVAAITMPVLIAKHRAQVLQTQFKKCYSEVSQALVQLKKEDEYLSITNGPQLQDFL